MRRCASAVLPLMSKRLLTTVAISSLSIVPSSPAGPLRM
jgi:hypothetical protein